MKKILLLSILLSSVSFANEEGKELHDESCMSCHLVEHDDKFYTKEDTRINDHFTLRSQVSRCSLNFSTGWFPDEEKSVVDYLNNQYYKFKE